MECCCYKNLAACWLNNVILSFFGNLHVSDEWYMKSPKEICVGMHADDDTLYIILYASMDNPSL